MIQRKDELVQALEENSVSDLKPLEERREVTKANRKGLEKNLADILKKSQAKPESGRLREREVQEKIEEDAKELEKANLELKAEKLLSWKNLQTEDVLKEAAEKAERKLLWGRHNTLDPSGLEAPRTQASAGQEVPCPSSHPKDLRVERGEGGPPPQVTWRHIT